MGYQPAGLTAGRQEQKTVSHPFPFDKLRVTRGAENTENPFRLDLERPKMENCKTNHESTQWNGRNKGIPRGRRKDENTKREKTIRQD
jgi:hypothetical protein